MIDFNKNPYDDEPPPHPGNGYSNGHDRSNPWTEKPWDHSEEPFVPLDYSTTKKQERQRPWLIPKWIPMLETTGLGGPGAQGKTLLACMLATAATLGGSWLNLPVAQMKSALILCEDRADDTLWRQDDINTYYGIHYPRLAGSVLTLPRRDNLHNYLAIFDRDGNLHETTFFRQLLKKLKEFAGNDPLLTVLDTRSDVFWGNQNDERHARMFVRKICDRIARETNGAVLLIYQPSLSGMREGTGTSGSVQWDAAFRSRLYLAADDSQDADPKARQLIRMKANYAEPDPGIKIIWNKGVFIPQEELIAGIPQYEILAQQAKWQRVFRESFATLDGHTKLLTEPERSPDWAPKKIATEARKQKDAPKIIRDADMASAMHQLIKNREFYIDRAGPPSRQQSFLKRNLVKMDDNP